VGLEFADWPSVRRAIFLSPWLRMKLPYLLLSVAVAVCLSGCGSSSGYQTLTNPVEFQLYDGNPSLPPQYQRILEITGKVRVDNVEITYRLNDKGQQIETMFKLEGNDYRDCETLINSTTIEKISNKTRPVGGSVFDVRLVDDKGKAVGGTPINRAEWEGFKGKLEERAKQAEAVSPKEKQR
jgi:hypothetical protein